MISFTIYVSCLQKEILKFSLQVLITQLTKPQS